MARVAVQLTNFTGGELSPRLDGRNDLGKYPNGCKTLENFVSIGRDIESLVLTRAINWHLEHRIIINENRTVVFN